MFERKTCLTICNAACCRDIEIYLRRKEYEFLVAYGAVLYPQWDKDTYLMKGDCPFLCGNKCRIRGSSNQPWICGQFQFLGRRCLERRQFYPELVLLWLAREKKIKYPEILIR